MNRGRQWHNEPAPLAPRKRFGNYLDHLILDSLGFGLLILFSVAIFTSLVIFMLAGLWDSPFWIICLVVMLVGGFLIYRDLRH